MSRVVPATRLAAILGDFDRSPAYRGLAEALRVLISDGRIPVGSRLPSERDLTDVLDVSRTTVTRAYGELRDHGYLHSRVGSGHVSALPSTHGHRGDHLLPPGDTSSPDAIDLTCAAPTPGPSLLSAYQRALERLPTMLSANGYYPSGLPELRVALADRYAAAGVPTSPDQIMIVPGALAGVGIVLAALVRRGNRVVVESPTYPNVIAALSSHGSRVVSSDIAPLEDGPEGLLATLTQARPAVAYLIPDFHNPTGNLMTDESRERVAAAFDGVPLIDESMVDLALDGGPQPARFAAYSPNAISVGSLSKTHWGGLRVGWIRTPQAMFDDLFKARLSRDLGVPLMEQLVAIELLATHDEALQHRRAQLRESRDAAVAALRTHLPDWRFVVPSGGLNLWCELPAARSTDLVAHAAQHGVLLAPGPSFAPEGGLDRFVRIPFTQPAGAITEAIEALAPAWAETAAATPSRRQRARSTTLVA